MADPKDTRAAAPAPATAAAPPTAAPPTAAPAVAAPPTAAEPKREYRAKHRIVGERTIKRNETLRLTDAEAQQYGDAVELNR